MANDALGVDEVAPLGPPRRRSPGRLPVLGMCLGLALAGLTVEHLRIADQAPVVGAKLSINSAPTGELDVTPAGLVASEDGFTPARPADGLTGRISVRNQTGRTLTFKPKAVPMTGELDDVLLVRAVVRNAELFRGTLGELRNGAAGDLTLASGEATVVEVHATLLPSLMSGYQGATDHVTLTFDIVGP